MITMKIINFFILFLYISICINSQMKPMKRTLLSTTEKKDISNSSFSEKNQIICKLLLQFYQLNYEINNYKLNNSLISSFMNYCNTEFSIFDPNMKSIDNKDIFRKNERLLSLVHFLNNWKHIKGYKEQATESLLKEIERHIFKISHEHKNDLEVLSQFYDFLKDIDNNKSIDNYFIMNTDISSMFYERKTNLLLDLKKGMQQFFAFFESKSNGHYKSARLKKQFAHFNFSSIYKYKICYFFLHLCQRFYQQVKVFLNALEIKKNIMNYVVEKLPSIENDMTLLKNANFSVNYFKQLFSLVPKKGDIIQLIHGVFVGESFYIVEKVIRNKSILTTQLLVKKVSEKEQGKINEIEIGIDADADPNTNTEKTNTSPEIKVPISRVSKYIIQPFENNKNKIYKAVINLIKSFLIEAAKSDSYIEGFMKDLTFADIEIFFIDLLFLCRNGFIKIYQEEAATLFPNDTLPTYQNLYRNNNLILLYLMKMKYEANKTSDANSILFFSKLKNPFVDYEKTLEQFTNINSITKLKNFNIVLSKRYFVKSMISPLIEHFDMRTLIPYFHFFFEMTFKNANIKHIYSKNTVEVWVILHYVCNEYGWFFFRRDDVFKKFDKWEAQKHLYVSRKFLLHYSDQLAVLDTAVSSLIDIIYFIMDIKTIKPSVNIFLHNPIFSFGSDFWFFKDISMINIYGHDYINAAANNYFYFNQNDTKNINTFDLEYSNEWDWNFSNVYSLAYNLFNELSIYMNIQKSVPLKYKLHKASSIFYFTILNIMTEGYDIFSRDVRYIFAAYVLTLVFFIESHIDVRRKNPQYFKCLQKNGLLYGYSKSLNKDLIKLEKKCHLLQNFLKINNRSSNDSATTHLEEVLKILNLMIFSLWAKESKYHFFYDSAVSPYKKLIVYCVYNNGETFHKKMKDIIKSQCSPNFNFGLNEHNLELMININLSLHNWNPIIVEKLVHLFILDCQLHFPFHEKVVNFQEINSKNITQLIHFPVMMKNLYCFRLGEQAINLIKSVLFRSKYKKILTEILINIYEFLFINKLMHKNVLKEFEEFSANPQKYEMEQTQEIISNRKTTLNETKRFLNNFGCYWINNLDYFREVWMYTASTVGTSVFIKSVFTEAWRTMRNTFKWKPHITDVEFFENDLYNMPLLDYYAPLAKSAYACHDLMTQSYNRLKNEGVEHRTDYSNILKKTYFQCKLNFYKNALSKRENKITYSDFTHEKVYVFKQPFYLMDMLPYEYKDKLLRIFLTESTLIYLLINKIEIPECFGICNKTHFNKVLLRRQQPDMKKYVINNNIVPIHMKNAKKNMRVFIHEKYISNLEDAFTRKKINIDDFTNEAVHVCVGSKRTYYTEPFLTLKHLLLQYNTNSKFPENHNYIVFLSNKNQINKHKMSPLHSCYISYPLSIKNMDIQDPYKDAALNLIQNISILNKTELSI